MLMSGFRVASFAEDVTDADKSAIEKQSGRRRAKSNITIKRDRTGVVLLLVTAGFFEH